MSMGASTRGRVVFDGGMVPDGCGGGGNDGGGIATEGLRGRGEGDSEGRGESTTFL